MCSQRPLPPIREQTQAEIDREWLLSEVEYLSLLVNSNKEGSDRHFAECERLRTENTRLHAELVDEKYRADAYAKGWAEVDVILGAGHIEGLQAAAERVTQENTHLRRDVGEWAVRAERLWQLLDDIDTLGDAAKGDEAAYRRGVRRLHTLRGKYADSDGYVLEWKELTDLSPETTGATMARVLSSMREEAGGE
jgi:hypothetical protein